MMANQQFFRTGFRGFRKQDVLSYIDSLRAEQQHELNDLQEQLYRLQELRTAEAVDAQKVATLPQLTEKLAQLTEQNAALAEQVAQLKEQNAALVGQAEQATEQLAGKVTAQETELARCAELLAARESERTALTEQLEQTRTENALLQKQNADSEAEKHQLSKQLEESYWALTTLWEEQRRLQRSAAASQDFAADMRALSRELCARIEQCAQNRFGGTVAPAAQEVEKPAATEAPTPEEMPATPDMPADTNESAPKADGGMAQWLF